MSLRLFPIEFETSPNTDDRRTPRDSHSTAPGVVNVERVSPRQTRKMRLERRLQRRVLCDDRPRLFQALEHAERDLLLRRFRRSRRHPRARLRGIFPLKRVRERVRGAREIPCLCASFSLARSGLASLATSREGRQRERDTPRRASTRATTIAALAVPWALARGAVPASARRLSG
eukprot:18803-Pelagococcus_subviridis.AAC.7